MDKQGIIVIDVGTSKTHANCINLENGELLAHRTADYTWKRPKEGFIEIDPEEIWEAGQSVCERVFEACSDIKIRALTFSWFGGNLIAMDQKGNALYPLIVGFDERATVEAEELSHRLSPGIASRVGRTGLDGTCTPAKMIWLKRHVPEVYARIGYMGTIEQFFLAKMGLPFLGERSIMQTLQVFDSFGSIMQEVTEDIGIPAEMFSYPREEGDHVLMETESFGRVRLPYKVPVLYGGHDCIVSQLGCGALPDGGNILGDVSGTYDLMGFFVKKDDLVADFEEGGFMDTPVTGAYSYMKGFPAGAELDHTVEMLWGECNGALLSQLYEKAAFDGVSGGLWRNPDWGNLRTDPRSLVRYGEETVFASLVEEATFRLKDSYLQLCKEHRGSFDLLRIGGGGSKSPSWIQLKADIFGLPVERVCNMEVSSVGSAIIAAVVLGIYSDYRAAASALSQGEFVCYPDEATSKTYDTLYKEWKSRKENASWN